MERTSLNYLKGWLKSSSRKPLVIRGARQVGKTWLVRRLAAISGKQIIELNFEKQPSYISLFSSNDPLQILLNLGALSNQKLNPENCLLFLDEIQSAPQLLSKLRWFAEDLPQLPVIAAGSLLEFVFSEYAFSMPVGRISYTHLEPLSFEEFLLANDKKSLYEYIAQYSLNLEIPITIHETLMMLFKEYLLVGGMPAVVANWISEHSLSRVAEIQSDLLATYRDDFSKYRGRIAVERLDEVMISVPKMLGQKFVFSRVNPSIQANTIKQVLDLLGKARICHRVFSSSANGIPLAAEIKEKYFKEIFLDIGLCSTSLGLRLNQINEANEIIMINNGGIAEQVVGQILRTIGEPYIEPTLYCWHREESGSNAEIDYIIQHGNKVIPIEVKAGATGSLKSLRLFMAEKQLNVAVRINSDLPSKINTKFKHTPNNKSNNNYNNKSNTKAEDLLQYTLISIPFYLVGQLHRLIESQFTKE